MNSENIDTEPSLQMHKLPSVLFFCGGVVGVGGGAGYALFWRGVGVGYTLHKGQHSL